jgi:hypothetical protein
MTLIVLIVVILIYYQQESIIVSELSIKDMAIRPRITITLDEEIYQELTKQAGEQERTPANLAAYIIAKTIKEDKQKAS